MSDTIFKGDGQPTAPEPKEPTPDTKPTLSIPPEASEFIGPGKKYATVEDALRSIPHAQTHIQTLEEEAKQRAADLAAARKVEEILEAERARSRQPEPTEVTPPKAPPVDNLEEIVDQTIQKREARRRAAENIDLVVSQFRTRFGDKAEDIYNTLAKETGLSVSALNNLSATSPTAVLKLAGLDAAPVPPRKTTGTVNTEAFRTNTAPAEPSAKVSGGSTKELVRAWKAAGEIVQKRNSQ